MDETTGQGTFKLPRRLPKQPNQAFYPDESRPVTPSRTKELVAEELVPVFEMGPSLTEPAWPEFPPQEFTATEEFYAPTQAFIATEEAAFPPAQEFIIPASTPLSTHSFFAPLEAPPIPPAPAPHPHQALLETGSIQEPAPSDSKPGIASVGDPKPAYARPSGPSRSRPSRPSGSFLAARPSGAFPTAEISKATFVSNEDKRSGEFASASIPTTNTTPRFSGEVSAVGDFAQETLPPRIATSARKRRASASAVPALIALSLLLVGYSFAVGPLESYLESLLVGSAGQSSALMTLVPWISLLPVILLLGGVLWIIAGLIGLRHVKPRTRKARPAEGRPGGKRKKDRRKSPLEQFREEAAKEGIDGTTAYQVWRLLQPFGPDSHVHSVYDELEGTLGMRPKDIQSVYQQLVPAEHQEERFRFRTVLDLLRIVKQASLSKA